MEPRHRSDEIMSERQRGKGYVAKGMHEYERATGEGRRNGLIITTFVTTW
jgi:hypothetical protein